MAQMNTKQKLGIAGAGMLTAGVSLTIAGLACLTPLVVSLAMRAVQKGTAQAIQGIERASKTAGTVAGKMEMAVRRATGAAKSV
jgi:uncharacterized membrane protein HdeD (DUF308 family)